MLTETFTSTELKTSGVFLKRTIRGTYVSVEPYHLFRYLDEQSFRFNNRKGNDSDRFLKAAKSITGKRVTYKAIDWQRACGV